MSDEPNNYAVFVQSKITGYTTHGDFVLTRLEAWTIALTLDVERPDFRHYVKQEGEA